MTVATFVLESTWIEDWDGAGAGESWSDEEAENALTWLSNIGSGAASGAATGAVAGPWGALIGGLVGGGLGAAQTALQQNQQNQQPKPPPPAPAAPQRPAPSAARPAPAPRPAPTRTIAVPRPAPTRPAPTTPAAPAGSVSTTDVAALVTTLAPMLLALGQQLASTPSAPAAVAPESWPEWPEDSDPWPVGEDVEPTEPLEVPPSLETWGEPEPFADTVPPAYDEPAGDEAYEAFPSDEWESEVESEVESAAECWPAESEWQEVPA